MKKLMSLSDSQKGRIVGFSFCAFAFSFFTCYIFSVAAWAIR